LGNNDEAFRPATLINDGHDDNASKGRVCAESFLSLGRRVRRSPACFSDDGTPAWRL